MSCHGCASKFGVFLKEKGCPKCGFAFCKKCLRFKVVVPELGSKEQLVCKNCYETLTEGSTAASGGERSRPAGCLRRLESLENPARPPIVMYHHNPRLEKLKTGLQREDREIVERLEKLKEERKRQQRDAPTEEDIVRRLAALKGEDQERAVETSKKKQVFHLPDSRSDEQKTNDLIKQLLQEQILAAKDISPEDLIAQRLARLRGEEAPAALRSDKESGGINIEALAAGSEESTAGAPPDDIAELMKEVKAVQQELHATPVPPKGNKTSDGVSVSSEEEEAEVKRVMQKAFDEAALGDDDDDDDLEESKSCDTQDAEELPWCTICNDDATVRCITCDSDLYCNRCFAEFHADPDMKDHRRAPFTPQKST